MHVVAHGMGPSWLRWTAPYAGAVRGFICGNGGAARRRLRKAPIQKGFCRAGSAGAGGRDIRPWWPIAQLAGLLPHGRFQLLPNAGHLVHIDSPTEIRSLIREFLSGQDREESDLP